MTRAYSFPPGFLWGAATASHQVEGGNRWNDWWEAEQAGRLPYASGDACRQFELFEQDFDMARAWGHNAHRLSIEWSRLEPVPGTWNEEAAAHYGRVIDALIERRLEPVVTLHHFTNPAWFAHRGGWRRRDSPRLFAEYVTRVAALAGGRVRYWVTINEPTVYVMQGYITGEWPPFRTSRWRDAAVVLRHLARAHVLAYRVLHAARGDAMVGFAHSAPVVEPCDPSRRGDRAVASIRDFLLNRAFFVLIGRTLDYVGVNYYTRQIVGRGGGIGALIGRVCADAHHVRGPMSTIGWEMYPRGLLVTLERFAGYGVPVMITENGIATRDEALRVRFLREHIAAAAEAIERGVPLIGYLYWSLIDNYEWAYGTSPTFGLAAVDYRAQTRQPRPAADEYAAICRRNGIER